MNKTKNAVHYENWLISEECLQIVTCCDSWCHVTLATRRDLLCRLGSSFFWFILIIIKNKRCQVSLSPLSQHMLVNSLCFNRTMCSLAQITMHEGYLTDGRWWTLTTLCWHDCTSAYQWFLVQGSYCRVAGYDIT